MRLQSLIAPVLGILMSGALLQPTLSHGSEAVQLPAPQMHGGMPLMEALSQRRSIRSFAEADLDEATLSTLLWAAFGINRPETGDRTAPSWRGSKETDIYVARADGVWLYDPQSHSLQQVLEGDIRAETGRQPFVEAAPVVLIYVADRTRMAEASQDDHRLYAHVDTAMIAQNVYLFAASEGLATVILGNVDKPALAAVLGLGEDQILTFTQPVGHRQ
jgi:SagB-type dehydrogenase family enzyme